MLMENQKIKSKIDKMNKIDPYRNITAFEPIMFQGQFHY